MSTLATSRQRCLKVAAATAALAALPLRSLAASTPDPAGQPALARLAGLKGLRFGTAVAGSGSGSWRNARLAGLIARECAILVPENEMKWQAIRPTPDTFDFAAFDGIAGFAA